MFEARMNDMGTHNILALCYTIMLQILYTVYALLLLAKDWFYLYPARLLDWY